MGRLKRLTTAELEALGIEVSEYPTTVEDWENFVRLRERAFLDRKHSGRFCPGCGAELKTVTRPGHIFLACPTPGCRRELRKIFLDDFIGEEAADEYYRWREREEKDRIFKSVVQASIRENLERTREASKRVVDMAWRVNYNARC